MVTWLHATAASPDVVVVNAVFLQSQLLGELDVTDVALVVEISLSEQWR